ncbi:MAG: HAMP domain-containing histidine kinase [Clostridia bacterium]|nr:HAMP domain-containing histidine kinase [Clostridia bacterium]
MFTKLRNRFLILNLITISVMMLIAFASIYLITYKNVRTDIDKELRKISESSHKPGGNFGEPRSDFGNPRLRQSDNINPRPERSLSFTLITDKQWNTINISSIFDMESEFYENAKNEAVSKNKDSGTFKLAGNHWAFIVNPAFDGYRIVFLDITSRQGILTNLIYTFLAVALVMLIFIFLISRFFANKSIKPVKEAFDKQKQFIADASHELKTPLAVINTNVDVLLSNSNDTIDNQSKWLHYIKSESERMTKLTNDLLYLTQMDYSDIKMIFTKFNLSEAVENVILTMEAVIFEHNISLNYDIEPDLMTHGNDEQIRQVIMILLDNAIKYTNTKGAIDISLKKHHNDIVLSVTNTGEGIPEEHLEKIFDRFYRTDKSRTRKLGGYGLGLAIAKAIVEQHKGTIYAKSVINESTTFIVELPLVSD